MRNTTIAVLAATAALTVPLAAQTQYNVRVQQAMRDTKYSPPLCPLKGGDFRTNSAGLYIRTAIEQTRDSALIQINIKKAVTTSLDAIAANPNNAAGWYYYGRASLMLGDLKAADSAFTHLEAISPDCEVETKAMRQKAWLALVNPSAEFTNKKMFDSALVSLRAANTISRYYPQAFYNLGATFANMKPAQMDSAIYYFKIAEEKSGKDPALAATLRSSIYNMGFLYQASGDNVNAIVQYRKYLAIDPTSEEVKRALAVSLRASGSTAEAIEIENQLMAAGKLSNNEMSGVGVRLFNEKNYAGAADAFKKVLESDPTNHDALFNLANSYLALENSKELLATSQKLLESDPLNPTNIRLLANGWRLAANVDKQVEVVTVLQAMTFGVNVERFTPRKDGAKLAGTISGIEGRDAADKVIPPTGATLVFEFIDAAGAVVATQEFTVQALAPNAKQELAIDVTGAGIIGWKYHKK